MFIVLIGTILPKGDDEVSLLWGLTKVKSLVLNPPRSVYFTASHYSFRFLLLLTQAHVRTTKARHDAVVKTISVVRRVLLSILLAYCSPVLILGAPQDSFPPGIHVGVSAVCPCGWKFELYAMMMSASSSQHARAGVNRSLHSSIGPLIISALFV